MVTLKEILDEISYLDEISPRHGWPKYTVVTLALSIITIAAVLLWLTRPPADDAYYPPELEVMACQQVHNCGGECVPGASGKLHELMLSSCDIDDNQLRQWLSNIDTSELFTLDLSETPITDQALATIAELQQLLNLDLSKCPNITASGLEHLANLKMLRRLHLNGGRDGESDEIRRAIVDAGLIYLRDLENLQVLDLSFTDVGTTNQGLLHLRSLEELKVLDLEQSDVRDDHLEIVRSFPKLESLCLIKTRISNNGLVHITESNSIRLLDLQGTKITDQGLVSLAKLTSLEDLNVLQTDVTTKSASDFRRKMEQQTKRKINVLTD